MRYFPVILASASDLFSSGLWGAAKRKLLLFFVGTLEYLKHSFFPTRATLCLAPKSRMLSLQEQREHEERERDAEQSREDLHNYVQNSIGAANSGLLSSIERLIDSKLASGDAPTRSKFEFKSKGNAKQPRNQRRPGYVPGCRRAVYSRRSGRPD